jgi:chorismate dehydratase
MPIRAVPQLAPQSPRRVLRIGAVSFLNTKPLIWQLDQAHDIGLLLNVPSALLAGLRDGQLDLALLPVIDYQRMNGLCLVPSAGIGCDGPTLTVRIFSRVPIGHIDTLACDTDSHTSVALARVILAERYGIKPQFVEWTAGEESPSASCLLIGDKVVCEEPAGFQYQLDLGQAWKELTGLPFVFAAWMARAEVDLSDLPQRLERAKLDGLAHVDQIIHRWALPRGWPEAIARQYLCRYLKYDIGPRQLQAISLFHRLASKHSLLPHAVTPLRAWKNPKDRPQAGL